MAGDHGTGEELRFRVEGMDCGSCAAKIDTVIRRIPGVSDVRVNANTGSLAVTVATGATGSRQITTLVEGLGYKLTQWHPAPASGAMASPSASTGESCSTRDDTRQEGSSADHDHDRGAERDGEAWWQTANGRIVLACCGALALAFLISLLSQEAGRWLYLGAALIGVAPIARRAYAAARAGAIFTIEMLMLIATAGAIFIGAVEEASVVVFLFAVGEGLERIAARSARSGIRRLGDLIPTTAQLEQADGTLREVPTAALKIGDRIVVRPGDRVPADGNIVEGSSDLDEAPVTGESMPRAKAVGADVFAGTINRTAMLKVVVTRPTADNTIARVIRLVEEAQEAKAPIERFIDRFARWYMPAVVALALMTAVALPLMLDGAWGTWVYRALALLLIGCPCALVIATPASLAAGLATGARHGLLLKGGNVIDAASRITIVAFDKTGTLTEGKPAVTDIRGFGRSERDVLALAAALETGSNHPIATAIAARARVDGVASAVATDVAAIPGAGMTGTVAGARLFLGAPRHGAQHALLPAEVVAAADALEDEGKTVALLVENRTAVGLLALRDEPRADAHEAVDGLAGLGLRGLMLTGDNERTAAAIATPLGLEYAAELMPDDKLRLIRENARGRGIAMVGDGINDAPALAAATIGVAMGGGTGIALETADAALVGDRISGIVHLIVLARRTMRTVYQNVAIALGLKVVFLLTTIAGLTGLWLAVLADTGATVLVTLNALRLLVWRGR